MWVIRAYNPKNEELVGEYELDGANRANLKTILGASPTPYGSTPLDGKRFKVLAKLFGLVIDQREKADYFLDFDADEPAPRRSGTRRKRGKRGAKVPA